MAVDAPRKSLKSVLLVLEQLVAEDATAPGLSIHLKKPTFVENFTYAFRYSYTSREDVTNILVEQSQPFLNRGPCARLHSSSITVERGPI